MKKHCLRCSKKKDIINFGKHPSNDDGYQIWCYDCQANYQKELYQKHAEDKKAKVSARRDKIGRLLDKVKVTNPCRCGEDEPLCLILYPLAPKTPRITKNSGIGPIKEALNGSAVICLNCKAKVEAGLLDAPAEPLRWEMPAEPEPEIKKPKKKPEPKRPALPPGASLESPGSSSSPRSDSGDQQSGKAEPLPQ